MKKFIFSLIFLVSAFMAFTQPEWVGFNNNTPAKPKITLTESNNQNVRFSVEILGLYRELITHDNVVYHRITIPGYGKSGTPGWPELPAISKLLAVPVASGITVTMSITDSVVLDQYNVYPAPTTTIDSSSGEPQIVEVFTKNDSVYSINEFFYHELYNIEDGGYLRSQKVNWFTASPARFNPVTQQLVVYTRFDVAIQFANPQTDINVNNGIFNRLTNSVLLNSNLDIPPEIPAPAPTAGTVSWVTMGQPSDANNIVADYLIITDDQFFNPTHSPALQELADHRAQYNGFDVAIVSIQNILTVGFSYEPTPEPLLVDERQIRTFIKMVYNGNHANHTYDGYLGYLCIVGDAFSILPTPGVPISWDPVPGQNPAPGGYLADEPSDYYYSCVTTTASGSYDNIGDIYLGRLSVDNENDLQNIVNKTIYNENEYTVDSWRQNTTQAWGGTFQGSNEQQTIQYFCNDLKDWIEEIQPPSYTNTLFRWDLCGTNWRNDYVNHINSVGSSLVFHLGHGQHDSWCRQNDCYDYIGPGALTLDYKMQHLSNDGKFPFVISQACLTGLLYGGQSQSCMGEKMLTYSSNAGYVAYIGAISITSMHYTAKIDMPFTLQEYVLWSIYHNLSTIIGEAILESRISVTATNPLHFEEFFFGDPALNLMSPGYEITHNTYFPPDPPAPQVTTISTKVYVRPGVKLTLHTGAELDFVENGQLIIDPGAILEICGNANLPGVTIKGLSENNQIVVNGTMCGTDGGPANPVPIYNLHLSALTGSSWPGIVFNNSALTVKMNGGSVSNCKLTGLLNSIELTNHVQFNNSKSN